MEVILLQDIKDLGRVGEIKRVADGYARNYLIPKGLASRVTPGARKQAELNAMNQARRQQRLETEASAMAEALSKVSLHFKAKSGEQGRLYGSITPADIVEALEQQTGYQIDKRKLLLEEPIRHTGTHQVEIKLPAGVAAHVEVVVDPEE